MKRNKGALMVVFAMFVNIVNYCFQILSGRFLEVADYGLVNTLFSLFMIFGAPYYAVRMIVSKKAAIYDSSNDMEGNAAFLTRINVYLIALSALVIAVVSAVYFIEPSVFAVDRYSLLIMSLLMAVGAYYMYVPVGAAQGFQMFFIMSFICFILAMMKILGLFVSVYALPGGVSPVYGIMIISIIGTAISCVIGYFLIRRKKAGFRLMSIGKARTFPNDIQVKDSLSTVAANCILIFLMNVDIVFVKRISDEFTTGLYTASTIWGKILFYAAMAIVNMIYPMFVKCRIEGKNPSGMYFKTFLLAVGGITFGAACVWLLSKPVVLLVFGERYIDSIPYNFYSYAIQTGIALNYLNMNYLLALDRGSLVTGIFALTAVIAAVIGFVVSDISLMLILISAVLMAAFAAGFVYIVLSGRRK